MIGPVLHCPERLRSGLLVTARPVVFDCETTGLDFLRHRVLSYGFRLWNGSAWENHILFTHRCSSASIQPHVCDDGAISHVLEALHRPDLVLVGHNLKYDLLMLRREGFHYAGGVRDTVAMLRLLDQDRGFSSDEQSDTTARGRRDLAAPEGAKLWLDYKLKNVCRQLLGFRPLTTPATNMQTVSYLNHVRYLASDLFSTQQLHDHLWRQMSPALQLHWHELQAPLLQILCDLTWTGVAGDREYAAMEAARLSDVLRSVSDQHRNRHGVSLDGMTHAMLGDLLYQCHRLPAVRSGRGTLRIDAKTVDRHISRCGDETIRDSLQLVKAWRLVESLRSKLLDQAKLIHDDGRFHSSFDNRQATGRISSTKPNLQQIAKSKEILVGTPLQTSVQNRDMVVATPGYTLVAADVAQADVRVLAAEIDRCGERTSEHRRRLHDERFRRLPEAFKLWVNSRPYRNTGWFGNASPPPPEFNPGATPKQLLVVFRDSTSDFYSLVAKAVAGESTTAARSIWKRITLAQINGKGAAGIAQELTENVTPTTTVEAKDHIRRFYETFPEIEGWLALQRQQVALAGRTLTWHGRMRTNSAQHWMVSEPRIRLLMTFHSGRLRWRYWLDVSPVRPALHYLTCYVHRVWNTRDENGEKPAKLIYDAERGRIGTKWYQHFDESSFYGLPYRNIAWRSIRQVQKLDEQHNPIEQVKYDGFDTTSRALVNAVMQGGTADLVALMMIRCQPVCKSYGARLVLNIHDELVFEVPTDQLSSFVSTARSICEQPPASWWKVPIVMEFKVGLRFGSLQNL